MELCFFFLEYVLALRLGDGQFSVIFSIEKQGMIRVYARILCILPSTPRLSFIFHFFPNVFFFFVGYFLHPLDYPKNTFFQENTNMNVEHDHFPGMSTRQSFFQVGRGGWKTRKESWKMQK